MKIKENDENGSVLIIILAVVTLSGLAFLGRYLWNTYSYKPGQYETILKNQSKSKTPEFNLTVHKSFPKFETLRLTKTDFDDPDMSLVFADAKKVYSVKLDGSDLEEIADLKDAVSSVNVDTRGDILVGSGTAKYEKVVDKKRGDPDYKMVTSEYHYYRIKDKQLTELKEDKFRTLVDNRDQERIYTKELANGQSEIWLDKMDGTPESKIGLLRDKILVNTVSDYGGSNINKSNPERFSPSFDGKYLLNIPPSGGGLGVPGIVVSRDGTKIYKIDFYWFVSSASWIGDDELLTKAQDGTQKLFKFKEDGTFAESIFEPKFDGWFTQNSLSPDRKYLLISRDNGEMSVMELASKKITKIGIESEAQIIKKYQFEDEILIDPRINHLVSLMGWNKNSDKIMFSEQISPFANTQIDKPTEIREIKIYDLKTGKIDTAASLNPHPKNADEYLIDGKPVSSVGNFAVR